MRMKRADRNYWSDDSHSWKASKLRRFNSVVYSHSSTMTLREMNSTNYIRTFTHTHTHTSSQKSAEKNTKKKWWVNFFSKMFDSLWLKVTAWVTRHTPHDIIFFRLNGIWCALPIINTIFFLFSFEFVVSGKRFKNINDKTRRKNRKFTEYSLSFMFIIFSINRMMVTVSLRRSMLIIFRGYTDSYFVRT